MLGLLSGGHCGLPILLLARRLIVVVATAAHLFMVTVNEKSIPLQYLERAMAEVIVNG